MSVVSQRWARDAANGASLVSAIVIAPEAGVRARIAAALAAQELDLAAEIEAPARIGEVDADASTIVVFTCDVDRPQEMTSLRRLCRETADSPVVVISPPVTGAGVRRTLDAGADALVFEPDLELTLAATVKAVASGQTVVPRKLRAGVERPNLSHREQQVLALVRRGLTNAEIAERLYLAESTVKSHLASVFTKFGVHSRKEAVAVFAELDPPRVPEPSSPAPEDGARPQQTTA
jgi:DNA-binding NarL/FixJ family response regulator